jgi:hypothetical protein
VALDTGSRRSEKETGTWSATEVDRGCVFFHSSIFAALPESQVLGTKQRGSWGIVCHADAKQAMQNWTTPAGCFSRTDPSRQARSDVTAR